MTKGVARAMKSNKALVEEYFDISARLNGDIASRRRAHAYMQQSSAIVHHRVVEASFTPKLFNAASYTMFKYTAENTHRILCKVIQHYLDNPSYRDIFDFDARLKELILLPRGYKDVLPFARVDTFYDEANNTLKFCEFNGDGSSGMNENREITHSIEQSATFKEFAKRHSVAGCELFESWVSTFIKIYESSDNAHKNPTFAICDYLDHGVVDEFYLFAKLFEARGYHCIVCDVRDISFDGKHARSPEGDVIDAIWRRCVTNDVLEFWDESKPFLDALRAGCVTLIGSFAGHIVHDKQIFQILTHPQTQAFLTKNEIEFIQETVPLTLPLTSYTVTEQAIHENKNQWIIKPVDHYGADNVYAGLGTTQEKWDALIERFVDSKAGFPMIAQHYIQPYKTLTLPPDTDIEQRRDDEVQQAGQLYNNLNGLYIYNGQFAGVFSRLGPLPTISKDMKGITAATIWVDVQ